MPDNEGSKTPEQQDAHTEKHGIGSTIADFVGGHKVMLIGAGIGIAVVLFIMSKSKNASSAGYATNQQGSLAGNQDTNTATALDQLTSTLNNFLANVPKGATGATGPAGPQGPTGPQGSPGTTGIIPTLHWLPPLIPYSQTWSGKHYFPVSPGHQFTWNGVKYWITGNTGGYITGVPGATSAQQAAGKGTVVLYAPASAYQKPVLNPLANHSPMITALTLSQNAAAMTDLSHPGVAGGQMAWNPVARVGHRWSEGMAASGADSTYIGG